MIRLSILILILMVSCINLFSYGTTLKARAVEKGPVIDGLLDDDVWRKAVLFTDFKMILPHTGQTPSEKTDLRVIYDKENLYIGVYCYTKDPSTISVTNLEHDQDGNGNDLIRILLDPFQDKRSAYVFFVTAKGARTDGLATGERPSTNWDGIWEAESKILADGWSCEFRIPFKTISFDPKLTEWGFNVERYIPKKIETIRLSGISKDSFFYNPAEAALLGGIENIKQGLGLTFKPFFTLEMARDYETQEDRQWEVNGGFDLYKNFTPNLVGVLTYRTDFAETEVDDRQVNLTRFPLYFREKRSFFLEGSEIFSFGAGGGHRPSFVPFFSRRIGLYEGAQVPIDWGAKVYGKMGRTNIALLDVQTRSTDEISTGNYAAGRIYQNIFSESKVGMIFTSGEPGSLENNTLLGFDFKYATSRFMKSKNFGFTGWWVYNWNNLEEGRHYGYGFKVEYPNDLLDVDVSYNYFGDSLEPGLAFLPRNDVQSVQGKLKFGPRPSKGLLGKLFRKISWESYYWLFWDLHGNLESYRISASPFAAVDFETGDRVELFFIFHRENLPESFEVSDGVVIPMADYKYNRYQLNIKSAPHRLVKLNLEFETGGFYSGDLTQLKLGMDFNYKGNLKLGLEGQFIRGDLPEGAFDENLYRVKFDYYLNAGLGLMTYVQYDSVSETVGANIRFKWRLSPGNTIYIVYNKTWDKGYDMLHYSTRKFLSLQDRGIFKIQLSWRP